MNHLHSYHFHFIVVGLSVWLWSVLLLSSCLFVIAVHAPLCFLFYFGNCLLSVLFISLLFDCLLPLCVSSVLITPPVSHYTLYSLFPTVLVPSCPPVDDLSLFPGMFASSLFIICLVFFGLFFSFWSFVFLVILLFAICLNSFIIKARFLFRLMVVAFGSF